MTARPRRVVLQHDDPITRELRSAIADDPRTCHALARDAGLHDMVLRRFVSRERSITLDSADRLASALGLKVVRRPSKAREKAPADPSIS